MFGARNQHQHYESLRRKEFDYLTALLTTLGKIDGLPTDQMDQARDALFHADHPYLMALVGPFNSGKSSLINALLGETILSTGATPTTSRITILRYGPAAQQTEAGAIHNVFHPAPLLQQISLVDTPGLESVFKDHDDITQRFLHRADLVLLVMLATQAMSANSTAYLQSLRAYGKRVIVVINQSDLLSAEEEETVQAFVAEQSKIALGFAPPIWMVSAKNASEAKLPDGTRDEVRWKESGFDQIEQYIDRTLGDTTRVKQKIETPLQIAHNVMGVARALVRDQQNALGEQRRAVQNVRDQIEASSREQLVTVRQTIEQANRTFSEAIRRGREAIQELFRFSRILSMAFTGLLELIGLTRLIRRLGGASPVKAAFEAHKINEPLDAVLPILDQLGPRLEGRDIKDIDDLIGYTRRELAQLPAGLQAKMIGAVAAPLSYDRALLQKARPEYQTILDQARQIEFERLDQAVQNWLLFIGAYQVVLIIAAITGALALSGQQNPNWLLLVIVVIIFGLVGLSLLPLRGRIMENQHAARMLAIEAELEQAILKYGKQQIEAGERMRREAVGPFLRLLDSQITHVDQLNAELEQHEHSLTGLEKELGSLR